MQVRRKRPDSKLPSDKETCISVPYDDLARLMFYLHCISSAVGHRIMEDYMTDFMQYRTLSTSQRRAVLMAADALGPRVFVDKIIVQHESARKTVQMVDASSIGTVSLPGEVVIFGSKYQVHTVMLCSSAWLDRHYRNPMAQLPKSVFDTLHCGHCQGSNGRACDCTVCQRFSWSQCSAPIDRPADAPPAASSPEPLPSAHPQLRGTSPGTAPPSSPPRPTTSQPQDQLSSVPYPTTCDGCNSDAFTGARLKCTACADYNLCQACYDRNLHRDTKHTFMKVATIIPCPPQHDQSPAKSKPLKASGMPSSDKKKNRSVTDGSTPKYSKPQDVKAFDASQQKVQHKPDAGQYVSPVPDERVGSQRVARSMQSADMPKNGGTHITFPPMLSSQNPTSLRQESAEVFSSQGFVASPAAVVVEEEEAGSIDSASLVEMEEESDTNEGAVQKSQQTPTALGTNPTEEIEIEPEDCVILVMGPTGTGKSTFISKAMGVDVGIGHCLASCTSTINTFRLPSAVEGSPMACLGDTKVVLVDTPGFDNTHKPDYEIFEMIAKWLRDLSLNSLGIAGLIYLQRISHNYMTGPHLKNLNMLRELCGKKFMTNVTLMTTMWADIAKEDAVLWEHELKGKYFKQFVRLGATVARFNDDQASVATILEPLVNTWRKTQDEDRILSMVRLQKEVIIYHLDIAETSAARIVRGKVQAILERREELLDQLSNQIGANKDDPELLQETVGEIMRLQGKLEEAQRDGDGLHLEFSSHLKTFMNKLTRRTHPLVNLAQRGLPSQTNPISGSSPVG